MSCLWGQDNSKLELWGPLMADKWARDGSGHCTPWGFSHSPSWGWEEPSPGTTHLAQFLKEYNSPPLRPHLQDLVFPGFTLLDSRRPYSFSAHYRGRVPHLVRQGLGRPPENE